MARYDYSTLDPSTATPVMFQGEAHVRLSSVTKVFGRKTTLEDIAEAFMTSPLELVHAVVHNEWNADALKALYEQARRDDVDPPQESRPGLKPFPRRRKGADQGPSDRRFVMGVEVERIARVVVHQGGETHFRCAEWQLGDVPLWIPLAEGLRQALVQKDRCEPHQRGVYECTPKRDSFAGLQQACKDIRSRAKDLKLCIDGLKQTLEPMMQDMGILAQGQGLLQAMDTAPAGDKRSTGQRLGIAQYRAKFEALYATAMESISRPTRYGGNLATFWKLERESAIGLIRLIESEQFRSDVDHLCANRALAPPGIVEELWGAFEEAYGALALSSQSQLVIDDLDEVIDAVSSELMIERPHVEQFQAMETDWLSAVAMPSTGKVKKVTRSALGTLAKVAEWHRKAGEAAQGIVMARGALYCMRWQPDAKPDGDFWRMRPSIEFMVKFFRAQVRVNGLSNAEMMKLAKAVDERDWETYRAEKGFAGKMVGKGAACINILLALAALRCLWKAMHDGEAIKDKDVEKLVKLLTSLVRDTIKVSGSAISKTFGSIAAKIADLRGKARIGVGRALVSTQKAVKDLLKLLNKLLEFVGVVVSLVLAVQALADDWRDDFSDRSLSIVHAIAAIGALAAVANLAFATAWLGPVAWCLGLVATVAEVAVMWNKSYATLMLKSFLEAFKKTQAYFELVTTPKSQHAQLETNPSLKLSPMPYQEPDYDAVDRAFTAAYKLRDTDCGDVPGELAPSIVTLGFDPKVVQFMTGEQNYVWAEWCDLVTFVK